MKITALTPRRGIAMLAGLVFLSLNSCKKDANITPAETSQTNLSHSFNFQPKTLASVLTSYTSSPALSYTGKSNLTISGLSIQGGTTNCITLINCSNIHVTQCSIGNATNVGINMYNCSNVTIDYCYFTRLTTGVYATACTGGIAVDHNQFLNMQGPYPRGQAVQFNQCSGAGNSISNNMIQNINGQSNTQEIISCYKTNGTAASPVQVNGNWIIGGGPSLTCGGLQLGDNGGSYISASNNVMVNPGAVGLSVSGGDHIVVTNNTVYSTATSISNSGASIWGQAGYAVTNCTFSGNKIKFMNKSGAENDQWIGPSTPTPAGWSTNTWAANIDASILPSSIITATAATVPLSSTTTTTTTTSSGSGSSSASLNISAPINYNGQNNITIAGLQITGGTSPCIHLTNCNNVFINLCTLINSSNVAVLLDNCSNVTIQQNNISNVEAGVVANNCTGGIKVFTNQMKNMYGTGYSGAFVQFNNVSGANNAINWNKMQNIVGQSNPVDAIDIVSSDGTSSSPITISTNQIEGSGTSSSGGGIQLGRNGGSYQTATGNILVNSGAFGMNIIGGDHISITNNSMYAAQANWTNVGIFVQSQGGHTVTNSTVSGNKVNWTNKTGIQASDWLAPGEATPSGWSSNSWAAGISASLLPASLF